MRRHASGASPAALGPSGSSAALTTVGEYAYGLFPGAVSSPSASVGPIWEVLQETAANIHDEKAGPPEGCRDGQVGSPY
jgi:hypothetical protein